MRVAIEVVSARLPIRLTASNRSDTETLLSAYARQLRADSERMVAARLQRGEHEGQLSVGFDCDRWAGYVACVVSGMSVQARDGATSEALRFVARTAASALEANRLR